MPTIDQTLRAMAALLVERCAALEAVERLQAQVEALKQEVALHQARAAELEVELGVTKLAYEDR